MDFSIQYDKDVISISSVKPVGELEGSDIVSEDLGIADFTAGIFDEEGYITISYAPFDDIKVVSKDGVIINIKGKVLSTVGVGSVSDLKIIPTPRETYPGSGIQNDAAIVGDYMSGENYEIVQNTGEVSVVKNGDVDGDGDIDKIDATIVLRHIAGIKKIDTSKYSVSAADCDGVSGINMLDVKWILNHTSDKTENTGDAKTYTHIFHKNENPEFFTISGNTSTGKGDVIYNGETLTTCLKMESATSISFTASRAGTITLIFGGDTVAVGKSVKIDGENYTVGKDNTVSVDVEAGKHTITKGDAINLYVMSFTEK